MSNITPEEKTVIKGTHRKFHPITAVEFLEKRMHNDLEGTLSLDLRPREEFMKNYLEYALNVTLPKFIVNRYLRNCISSFELTNVLIEESEKQRLKIFTTSKSDKKIVVYDYNSDSVCVKTSLELFIVLDMLSRNIIKIFEESLGDVGLFYLEGGFAALYKRCISMRCNSSLVSSSSEEDVFMAIPILSKKYIPRENKNKLKVSTNVANHISKSDCFTSDISGIGTPKFFRESVLDSMSNIPMTAGVIDVNDPDHKNIFSERNSICIGNNKLERPMNLVQGSGSNCNNVQEQNTSFPSSSSMEDVSPFSFIMPFLIIGSDEIFKSDDAVDQLERLKTTHIINMTTEESSQAVLRSGKFIVNTFPVEDSPESDISLLLDEVIDFIHFTSLQSSKYIFFVHCEAGRSRSATIAIAYLMKYQDLSLKHAYERVKLIRPAISPNLGFFVYLHEFGKKLSSRRGNNS